MERLLKDLIFRWTYIFYVVAADENNPYSYNDWETVINLDGIIHRSLGPSLVDPNTNEWSPGRDSITLNVHRDNGFLRVGPITNSTGFFFLQQYNIYLSDENNEIQMIGGQMKLYGIFLGYGNDIIQEPVNLFQTQAPILGITLLNCDFSYTEIGQTCVLIVNIAQEAFQSPGIADYSIKSLGCFLYYTQPIVNDATSLNLFGFVLGTNGMQQDDGTENGIIRQIISVSNNGYDTFVKLNDDETGSIINITIIDNTFNKPGGKYYVLIDDGFVKDRKYQEPILELAKAIPVSPGRITTNGRHEIDTSVSPEQYLLSINIKKAMNKDEERSFGSYAIFECGISIAKFASTILFASIDAGSVENVFTTSSSKELEESDVSLGIVNYHSDDTADQNSDISEKDGKDSDVSIQNDDSLENVTTVLNKISTSKERLQKINELTVELRKVKIELNKKIAKEKLKGEVQEELNKADKLQDQLKCGSSRDLKKKNQKSQRSCERNIRELIEALEKTKGLKEDLEYSEEELETENKEEIFNKHDLREELEGVIEFGELIQTGLSLNNKYVKETRRSEKLIHNFKSIKDKFKEKFKRYIEEDQPSKKKYRKFSKWLKDHRDNQIIIDISHLKLLGSTLQIQTSKLNWLKSKVPSRIRDLNFDASQLFWEVSLMFLLMILLFSEHVIKKLIFHI
ncbi:hypothetical protein GLOIN_2v1834901 [Rhizophagus clarus]|uniref:Uncharacterized protein n=1 Tax=Rhizophagus clarus TaxID=94130 RepID=A0A8H3KY44_9GLOM|nr:hypothetical protein GLOIN_2v1834901 [Rhizophagus clarus]